MEDKTMERETNLTGNYSSVLEKMCGMSIEQIVDVLYVWGEETEKVNWLIGFLQGREVGDLIIDFKSGSVDKPYCLVGEKEIEIGTRREDEYGKLHRVSIMRWDRLPGEMGYVLGIYFVVLLNRLGEKEMYRGILEAMEVDFSNFL